MSVRPLYKKTPSHLDLLDPKETVPSHNKVTGWSVNLPIAKTCPRCFHNSASNHAHKVTGVLRAA
jgi:hypothetical protein